MSGRLQVRSYDTPEGQKVSVTEVVADEVRFLLTSQKPVRKNRIFDNISQNLDFDNIDGDRRRQEGLLSERRKCS